MLTYSMLPSVHELKRPTFWVYLSSGLALNFNIRRFFLNTHLKFVFFMTNVFVEVIHSSPLPNPYLANICDILHVKFNVIHLSSVSLNQLKINHSTLPVTVSTLT